MPLDASIYRAGGVAAIAGAVILLAATMLHPMDAQPGNAPAAFAEYAADRFWVITHLGQLVGAILMGGALVSLSWRLRQGRSGVWAIFGAAGAIASLALAAALQAVDGIALKMMVDRWASAAAEQQATVFEAAFAVRQIEIGLASMLGFVLGLTVLLQSGGLLSSGEQAPWLGWLGLAAGITTFAASIVQAHVGFSEPAMTASMAGSLLLLLWMVLVGMFLLRSRP